MRPEIEDREYQNRRPEPMGRANISKTHRLPGMAPGLAHQDAADQVLEPGWN